jgi:FtsP/CotA-like multicopper oxidase with cupredoxin domain
MKSGVQGLVGAALISAALFGCGNDPKKAPSVPAIPTVDAGAPTKPAIWGMDELEDKNPDPNVVEVFLEAAPTTTTYKDGKTTKVVAYNGSIPGPLLRAKVGDDIVVHFTNKQTVPTTIHWHGLRISDQMDGSPRIQTPVPPGGEFVYRFKAPDAGSFWYHPHVHANDQIESGLYGPIVIEGDREPEYDLQRYLVLDDVGLDDKGQLTLEPFTSGMTAMHGRIGNVLLTNGKLAANAQGEAKQGHIERWRMVNSANARTFMLELEGAQFRVIGTDGGLLASPYTTKRVTLPVGARYDLEVTYDQPGTAKLVSYIYDLDANQNVIEVPTDAFRVDVAPGEAPRTIDWPEQLALPKRLPDQAVNITIDAIQHATGSIEWQLNGMSGDQMSHDGEPMFTFKRGDTVRIKFENKVGPEHPFHLHGQFFAIRDAKLPGLKDVVLVPGMGTVEVDAYFDNPGRWMAHCHNLEHAELGMMTEIVVE